MIKIFTVPVNGLTQEEKNKIHFLLMKSPVSLEEKKTVNALLMKRLETLQLQYKRIDEDYRRVADGHTGDFEYLCNVSSRRAELYKTIENFKNAILKNKKVIDDEEHQDH